MPTESARAPVDYRVLIDGVRERLASYLGANASDLVLVENASAAINGVYRSFRFQPGYAYRSRGTDRCMDPFARWQGH